MLIQGNALHVPLADRTVHCAVESPPYWGLREYNLSPTFWPAVDYAPLPGLPPIHVPAMVCCLGNEETVEAYVGHMVLVGREHRRVLRSDGTWWLNLGDSYAQDSKWGGQSGQKSRGQLAMPRRRRISGRKDKDLVGVPWLIAFALQADGWYLRTENIWHKPNSLPESVADRPSRDHEYVFLLTRSPHYFYDRYAIPHGERIVDNMLPDGRNPRTVWTIPTQPYRGAHFAAFPEELPRRCLKAGTSERGVCPDCGAPWARVLDKRPAETHKTGEVHEDSRGQGPRWEILGTAGWRPTCRCYGTPNLPDFPRWKGEPVADYARQCEVVRAMRLDLLAHWVGLPVARPVILDAFGGSGTTGAVAHELGLKAVLIEPNPAYLCLARGRIAQAMGPLFAPLALGLAPSGFTLAEAGRSVCATFSEAEAAEAVVDLDRTQEVVAVAVK